MTIEKRGRAFAVLGDDGELLVLCLYKRGAEAVAKYLAALKSEIQMRVDQVDALDREVSRLTRKLREAKSSGQVRLFG